MAKMARPPQHGDVSVTTMPMKHAKAHLSSMTASAAEMRDYHTGGVTGQNAQGGMSPGGASGADYETTSTGNTGDADSST